MFVFTGTEFLEDVFRRQECEKCQRNCKLQVTKGQNLIGEIVEFELKCENAHRLLLPVFIRVKARVSNKKSLVRGEGSQRNYFQTMRKKNPSYRITVFKVDQA